MKTTKLAKKGFQTTPKIHDNDLHTFSCECLWYDPETDEESSSIYDRLSAIRPVINVQLTGSDPADISTEQLAEIISNHAEAQEIEIPLSN
jgi:hypothetical protein